MKQYENLNIIGQGAFGNAYLGYHKAEDKHYVIKKIELAGKNQEQVENIFHEVRLLEEFKHVNIVSYKESIREGQWLNIIMEFCSGGDLNQLITEQKENLGGRKVEQKRIVEWAAQIGLAIFYMHDKRILHRDLKTPNIFIMEGGMAKLGDFGISKVLDEKIDLASTAIGTPYYMSPEQYKHKPYSYKSDIWAFGCILYEMCNQKRPFEAMSINALAVKVMEATFAPVSQFYSKQLRQLIKKMLQKKEKERPSILEFLQTPIIRRKVMAYLKETYTQLLKQNGDQVLIDGVLYQAKKLGLNLKEAEPKKVKPEFSVEKKKQEKERIRHQLQEQIRKLSEESKKEKQKLKQLKNDVSKEVSHPWSAKKPTTVSEEKAPSVKESVSTQPQSKAPSVASKTNEKSKPFKIEEDYTMYEDDYEEDSEEAEVIEEENQAEEDDSEEQHSKGKSVLTPDLIQEVKQEREPIKQEVVKPVVQQKPAEQTEKNQKARFSQMQPVLQTKNQSQVPVEEAIQNIKESLKSKEQQIYTMRNDLSNLDFSISSSEDEFQKPIEAEKMPKMKKKQKNPAHVMISDRLNDLRQGLEVVLEGHLIDRLLVLARSRKSPTRTQIQKICGIERIGSFHLAGEIVKIQALLEKVPVYE